MREVKILEKKEWVQEPYKARKILGLDFWFWMSVVYFVVWLVYWLPHVISQPLPGWTRFSILLLSLGCWMTYTVGTIIVQFRKGGDQ
jgi:hypothetical protein